MFRWGLVCIKSRIVLEGKEAVLISSLFKLFIMMLVEELLGKVMNTCVDGLVLWEGELALIRGWCLSWIFKGFWFSKVYKRFGI